MSNNSNFNGLSLCYGCIATAVFIKRMYNDCVVSINCCRLLKIEDNNLTPDEINTKYDLKNFINYNNLCGYDSVAYFFCTHNLSKNFLSALFWPINFFFIGISKTALKMNGF